jgi:hypothetical protein
VAEGSSILANPPKLRGACPPEKETGPLAVQVEGRGSEALRSVLRSGAVSAGAGLGPSVACVDGDGDPGAVCVCAADGLCPPPDGEAAAECGDEGVS